MALSPIATLVHRSAAEPISLGELTDVVVAAFGAPPGGSATTGVADVVRHLLDVGLLDVSDG